MLTPEQALERLAMLAPERWGEPPAREVAREAALDPLAAFLAGGDPLGRLPDEPDDWLPGEDDTLALRELARGDLWR